MTGPCRAQLAAAESSAELLTKPVLTAEEVAELLGFAPAVLYRAVHDGELVAIHAGHAVTGVAREHLIAWLGRRAAE
ncbi:MAG TPA: helix-turn-helix domain-containing protein [Thermomicrobiales bacterium]|nr:helix-turn-helix domain-containing protein [Thermomicrobiales bacterium]